MDQVKPLGAQISQALKDRDVEVIFGIPGVHNVELYRGIEDSGLRHVLARHEQGAVFMADGYARACGKPGVAYLITGPGMCNAMTPMGQAYSDSVPVLIISSCLEREHRSMWRGRLHEMKNQELAADCVCDWSITAPDAKGAYRLIDRAFSEFVSKRPLPKHIQVPIDVLGAPEPAAPVVQMRPEPAKASASVVAQVADRLAAAKRPLFVFGGGATKGWKAARQIVDETGAASFCTYAGRGIIPAEQPLNFGSMLGRTASLPFIRSADLVVVVGSNLSEVDLWRGHLGHKAPMVRVDIDPQNLVDDHPSDLAVLGDAGAFLEGLAQEVSQRQWTSGWSASEVAGAISTFRKETEAGRRGIVAIVDAMKEALPEETMFYSDMTQFAYVAKEIYPMSRPGHWHHPTGFGTLGYALPAAIGGKVAAGDQPVVAIAGDYGFQYTLQELGTAMELGLNLPIVLWDNGKLKEIEDCMIDSQIAPNSVVAANPDFSKLAAAYGMPYARPDSLEDFQAALQNALSVEGPSLIHVTPAVNP